MLNHVNFLGVGINPITYQTLFSHIDKWIANKNNRSYHIACINAFNIALSLENARLREIYNSADIVGADGMPFVRWIRSINKQACDRIAAPDTILALAEHAKTKNYTFYLYGGAPEVCENMKLFLEKRFPHIKIIGHYSPPFRDLTPDEDQACVDDINRLAPDIICVGLGTPKQDYWIADHLYRIRGSVLIASGATFDFFGGRVKMAPKFIRLSGFEWMYRLFGKDFKRLWKRYTIMYSIFIFNFSLQKIGLVKYPLVIKKHD